MFCKNYTRKRGQAMLSSIGNTPIIQIAESFTYLAKIEGANPFGSMKDRAAAFVIEQLLDQKIINSETEIVESSSGNFGISLAAVCRIYGLKYICVTDPMIAQANREILNIYGADVVCANQCDENGSYLKCRLEIIEDLLQTRQNVYWVNQYNNPLIIQAYENTLAEELLQSTHNIDYVFIPVSTCGCISGISRHLKKASKNTKIIAVDIRGSCIFGPSNYVRHIPGMGASFCPDNLRYAIIDEVITVSELECVTECRKLIHHGILAGASSGGAVAAIRKMNERKQLHGTVVAIFPDRGERYADTVYSNQWCQEHIQGFT